MPACSAIRKHRTWRTSKNTVNLYIKMLDKSNVIKQIITEYSIAGISIWLRPITSAATKVKDNTVLHIKDVHSYLLKTGKTPANHHYTTILSSPQLFLEKLTINIVNVFHNQLPKQLM